MAVNAKSEDCFKRLSESLSAGNIGKFYLFHGEERYLLRSSLEQLRKKLCPEGLDGFNYKRYDGKNLKIEELFDAINTLPASAERTLIEVHDFDVFKHDQKQKLADIFADLPSYVCIVLIYDTIEYSPDRRVKLNTQILSMAEVIEFVVQDQNKLVNWIKRHFIDAGKKISSADAEYLAFITGGYMNNLYGEIGKTAAYAKGESITRDDVDAVVTPVLDTVAYKLTDAISKRDHASAVKILDELIRMRESPHKLLFSISLKMRQILTARVCIDAGAGTAKLREICGINHEFAAKALMETARRLKLPVCRNAVLLCSETAFLLNSSSQPEARLTELIAKLAFG